MQQQTPATITTTPPSYRGHTTEEALRLLLAITGYRLVGDTSFREILQPAAAAPAAAAAAAGDCP